MTEQSNDQPDKTGILDDMAYPASHYQLAPPLTVASTGLIDLNPSHRPSSLNQIGSKPVTSDASNVILSKPNSASLSSRDTLFEGNSTKSGADLPDSELELDDLKEKTAFTQSEVDHVGLGENENPLKADSDGILELEGDKVFLGTEALTGKAIIKDRLALAGGPFTVPKYRHSLPFLGSKNPPPPPPDSLEDAKPMPDAKANLFSLLTFNWIAPIMALGAARQLAPTDLYKLRPERDASYLSQKLGQAFQKRWEAADAYNILLEKGQVKAPLMKRLKWTFGMGPEKGKTTGEKEKDWRERTGRKEPDLAWALSDVFGMYFWSAGLIKVFGDTAQIMTSLVVKAIITFSTEYSVAKSTGAPLPNIGRGIGMCIGLFLLLVTASLCVNHFFLRSAGTGVLARAALISALYERAINLSNRARIQHPNGKLVNHISTDVSRIDFAAGLFHMCWTAPVQFIVVVVILLVQIQESALVGIFFLVVLSPIQTTIMKHLFSVRKQSMIWTDKRARLLQELLSGMKVVKLMAWEKPFLKRLDTIRKNELSFIKKLMVTRSGNMAIATSVPVIAAILSFVTYASVGNTLDPATLFTVLTLFQLLRLPLMVLPMTLSAITDSHNALGRVAKVFTAETINDQRHVDFDADFAVRIENATFTWDASEKPADIPAKGKKSGFGIPGGKEGGKRSRFNNKIAKSFKWKHNKKTGKIEVAQQMHVEIAAKEPGLLEAGSQSVTATPGLSPDAKAEADGKPEAVERIFQLKDVNIEIPRDCLIAVVGAIGSGKSSLLSALFGEMRRLEGKVTFGGSSASCSQVPWICNATVRENILFGRPFEEERYWDVIHKACLETDLELLPNGDAETIGEKGVNLSGGQKARVNIARAIYHQASITAFDDPLAAVDPGIASLLFDAIADMQGTRILITHAIHLVPKCDYIITMHEGEIAERGTYEELKTANGPFAHLMREFANDADHKEEEDRDEEGEAITKAIVPPSIPRERLTANLNSTLMSSEIIHSGTMGAKTYGGWLKAANGKVTMPLLFLAVVISQALTILTSYWLVYWQEDLFNRSYSFYEGLYVLLGVATAFAVFIMGSIQAYSVYNASVALHDQMIQRIMHAPSAWFDTTPLGRILNRLTKDIDTLDNTLGDALRMLIQTSAGIAGAVVLISIVEPYFLIAVLGVFTIYGQLAWWYQKSALAFKRIDGVLRSPLYAHFSESLAGVAVIRSFDAGSRFVDDNCRYMSIENRAYYLTVVNQRWLGIRLDALGSLLSFIVGIIVVIGNENISPSKGGLILSYMVTIQQSFSWLCRQFAEVQNDMASAERVLEYANDLDQELPHDIPDKKPPSNWPAEGRIDFQNVIMGYRPELPAVLKNFTLSVRPAEKVAVVGRTGAGKSTIMSTLYRLVEVRSGSISIDGLNIADMGLFDLRSALSIIPQEAVLFSGTIRSNVDPFGEKTDAELWDALRRAHLIEANPNDPIEKRSVSQDDKPETPERVASPGTGQASRFTLDTPVEEDGSNFSAGERSLISLARALVRDAKIVVLDEATAAVDLATDAKIQTTIRSEFRNKTLLCIAHRLRTILYYDRVLVMNAGEIAEFDTPENLFLRGEIFKEMCDKSNIDLQEIRAAQEHSH